MSLPSDLSTTLGWLSDLFAQHLYDDDVPIAQRRRWSLDGDGWTVVDDSGDQVARISLSGDFGTTSILKTGSLELNGIGALSNSSDDLIVGYADSPTARPDNIIYDAGNGHLFTISGSGTAAYEFDDDTDTRRRTLTTTYETEFETAITAGGGWQDIFSYETSGDGADTEYEFSATVFAYESGGTDRAVYNLLGAANLVGGTRTVMGYTLLQTREDDASWGLRLAPSASDLVVLQGSPDGTNTTTFAGTVKITRRNS